MATRWAPRRPVGGGQRRPGRQSDREPGALVELTPARAESRRQGRMGARDSGALRGLAIRSAV